MSSGRVLGRGRVLGNAPSSAATTLRGSKAAALPPSSDSSASLTSSVSASTAHDGPNHRAKPSQASLPSIAQDLTSNVSLSAPTHSANASTQLICPICNEQMVTLLQLNRHLDDAHQNLEEVQQDEVKNWFQAQVDKAKKLPALAVLEQKFKALDVFESNSVSPPQPGVSSRPLSGIGVANANGSRQATPEPPKPRDPEEEVSRKHWQKPSYGDVCAEPVCSNRLGSSKGSVNCRKCGRLFCEDHTLCQMKLSKTAHHDPVRGVWCRVCETCYKSRKGYSDTKGGQLQTT